MAWWLGKNWEVLKFQEDKKPQSLKQVGDKIKDVQRDELLNHILAKGKKV